MKPAVDRVSPATDREHLATVLFGLWMTVGLFLDGYFHQNLEGTSESFLTPWHGVFYSGFVASALWLAAMARRRAGRVDWRLRCLPAGYEGARLGIVLFALGGFGDGAWHSVLGVERGIDALLSPTHLVLFAGLALILTAPLRAPRAAPSSRLGPWIIVGSLASATALVGFFLNFVWGLGIAALARTPYDSATEVGEIQVIAGVASMLVTTVLLFAAARFLFSTGRVPVGAFTVLFGVVALLVSLAFDEDAEGVVAALLAGLALDAVAYIRRGERPAEADIAAPFGLVSCWLWFVYLGLLKIFGGIDWSVELWLGAVVLNGLAAYALASVDAARSDRSRHRNAPDWV